MIEIENVGVRFGGVVALNDVSASFTSAIGGIIGPNGAGKTTLKWFASLVPERTNCR